jgi:phage baseplate assembly protein gpV
LSDIDNLILGVIERWWASRYSERHGIVTSYDPKKYLAKVTFQPEGQESGWLPIETGHIGEGYGVTIGLQPGKGGVNDKGEGGQSGEGEDNQGDQVIVRFQEGDFEGGKIVQRVHSDQDKPPETQSGEIIIWTKFQKSGGPKPDSADGGQGGTGQQIALKKDGSIAWTDGNGATIKFDGKGNVVIDCKTFTVVAQKDVGIKGSGNVEVKAGGTTGIDGGSKVVIQGGGDVSDGSVTPPGDQPQVTPFEVPNG